MMGGFPASLDSHFSGRPAPGRVEARIVTGPIRPEERSGASGPIGGDRDESGLRRAGLGVADQAIDPEVRNLDLETVVAAAHRLADVDPERLCHTVPIFVPLTLTSARSPTMPRSSHSGWPGFMAAGRRKDFE